MLEKFLEELYSLVSRPMCEINGNRITAVISPVVMSQQDITIRSKKLFLQIMAEEYAPLFHCVSRTTGHNSPYLAETFTFHVNEHIQLALF